MGSLLIDRGAELDRRNHAHETALSLAAHTGHASFVDLLLRHGASLQCHPFGNTFEDWLNWASRYGRCSERSEKSSRGNAKSEPNETVPWIS